MSKSNQEIKRDKVIVRTSLIGILTNIILSSFKAVVGFISNSIAVILDAVNNLSDALSSIITIIGTKLASKLPNKKHPLGYGRIEYITAMIVAGIVLYAGITAMVESIKKIITPSDANYDAPALIIISVAVVVKLILGLYVVKQGKRVNSGSLIASGKDAMFDSVISLSVLISAIIYLIFGVSLEAYVGVLISIFIIKSGIEMMFETLNEILGRRADKELTDEIKAILNSEEIVKGAYDLIIYNYGPDKNYASVHLELPDTMTVMEVDKLTRKVEENVYKKTGVILAAVGVYSYNTQDTEAANIELKIREIVLAHDFAIQLHGFYIDKINKNMRFDVVFSFEYNQKESLEILYEEIKKAYPDYSIYIAQDVDISD
ncbi:cation transporter [bacterium]|nr:cation transporter [bacterium]